MSKQLEALLRQTGVATDAQLKRAQDMLIQAGSGNFLEMLMTEEHVSEDAVAEAFVTRLKVSRIRIAATIVDPEAMKKVPERLARKHLCLPMAIDGRVLALAMMDPIDYQAIQDVEFSSALAVRPLVATRTEILDGIEERYGAQNRIGSFLANMPDVLDIQIPADDSQDLADDARDVRAAAVAPVVTVCKLIIHDAINAAASDVHIEPALHDLQVRMRVDGVLRDYARVPKWLHDPLVSRLKALAKLDLAERRLPQDGRVNVQYQGTPIGVRVSTLLTHFGEKVVLRVLGSVEAPDITQIGLSPEQQLMLERAIAQPQGMIFVTGPTGSGKSTTLYALLARHHRPEIDMVTVEDPIECQLAGIYQVQINTKAGLTFAGVLRSVLRQDPDVVLVGELRDRETSEIAFQAAMNGHMVLSTLHANSAVAAVSRLFDMGIDPSIVATSLTMVIAQRLLRRICHECREAYEPDPSVCARVGLGPDHGPVYRGAGCPACGGTGFSGRVGIFEIFRPTNTIRRLIKDQASESEIRNAARQAGFVLLREDALAKILSGLTSPDEVLRVVQLDETEVPCPHCGAIIEADFATCPYCTHSLKRSCDACGQSLKLEWKVCPYCNSAAVPPSPTAPAATAGQGLGAPSAPPSPSAPAATAGQGLGAPSAPAATAGLGPGAPSAPPSPSAPAATADQGPGAPTAPLATADEPGQRPMRILVVDDDADIRKIVELSLRKLSVPVEIEFAADGVEAVEKALANPPDMVVLDVMMPRMDGFGVCRALRENVRTAFVPVLMLTASADQASRTQGYLVGTDDYMGKPFLPVDLNLRVTRLLRRTYGI
jgi:type II secretory ATPase GspE/PulE/Tfp pilus assembly ATPase PilB-like protein/RNA polymerase subunit RPABC4/transcription elongation factor Spt4